MIEISQAVTVEIAKLSLQPGDKLVVTCDEPLTHEQMRQIREAASGCCNLTTNDVIVLAKSMGLKILRKTDLESAGSVTDSVP